MSIIIVFLVKSHKVVSCFVSLNNFVNRGLVAQLVKNLPAVQKTQEMHVQSQDWEDPLEEGKATHCSVLTWRIPWTALSMWSQRVGQH